MKEKIRYKKSTYDDRGSTLITVIVAIAFVTILTTIILGTSLTSFRMKAIDRRAKDDFYFSERALNDVYTGLGQKISVIAAKSYDRAFSAMGGKVGTVDLKTAQTAQEEFKKDFVKNTIKCLQDNKTTDALQKFIVPVTGRKSYVTGVGAVEAWNSGETDIMDTLSDETPSLYLQVASMRIRDVKVVCVDDKKDYKSEIITDIVVTIPHLDFFENNADIVDYAIIANDGIVVNGDVTFGASAMEETLEGETPDTFDASNVYAGMTSSGGGFAINRGKVDFEGNYLISKGDITVGSSDPSYSAYSATLQVGKYRPTRPNMWFDSIVTPKDAKNPVIDVYANSFALNDTELNANKSKAKFKGAYFGYDEGYFAQKDDELPTPAPGAYDPVVNMLIDPGTKHSDSSSIIINGNECTLDMKELTTLVLMGKAYIEIDDTDNSKLYEISTAEASALKTNQQVYLVPPDFLTEPNPSVGTIDYTSKCIIPTDWFAFKYLKNDGHDNAIIQSITVGPEGDKVSYAFLLFDDKATFDMTGMGGTANMKARSAFIYEIMHSADNGSDDTGCAPKQSQLKKRLANSMANYDNFRLQECVFNNGEDANIFSVNALVNYKIVDADESLDGYAGGTKAIGDVNIVPVSNNAALDRYMSYPKNLFRRFQWLCDTLNANEDIPLSQNIKNGVGTGARGVGSIDEASAWSADSAYPYKYYIKTPASAFDDSTDEIKAKLPTGSYGHCIYWTDTSDPYDFSGISSPFRGIVISEGDITVPSGMEINGTLIANGIITFQGNNLVKGDKALLQKRIAKETELVKSDGNYYNDYLISYLDDGTGTLLYGGLGVEPVKEVEEDIRINYSDYMFFENWKKGGR